MCIVFICKCQRIMTSDNDKIIMRRSAKHWYSVVVIGPMCNRFSANIIKKKMFFLRVFGLIICILGNINVYFYIF